MNTNPYAPPNTPLAVIPQATDLCVDGDCLVVRNGVTLPLRCVTTNEPISSQALREFVYDSTPSFRLVLRRYQCRVMYGHATSVRQKRFRRVVWKTIIVLLFGLSPFVFATLRAYLLGGGFRINIGFLIPLMILLLLMNGQTSYGKLRVVKSEPDRVWLSGCCPEFLAFIRREYGTLNAPVMKHTVEFETKSKLP